MKLRKAWAIVDAYSGQPRKVGDVLAIYASQREARQMVIVPSARFFGVGDVQVVPVEIHAVSPAARTKKLK